MYLLWIRVFIFFLIYTQDGIAGSYHPLFKSTFECSYFALRSTLTHWKAWAFTSLVVACCFCLLKVSGVCHQNSDLSSSQHRSNGSLSLPNDSPFEIRVLNSFEGHTPLWKSSVSFGPFHLQIQCTWNFTYTLLGRVLDFLKPIHASRFIISALLDATWED